MTLSKLTFRPGFIKEVTDYTLGPGWHDGDKVRFRQGMPEQIGGWQKYSSNTIKGVARSLYGWKLSDDTEYMGVGTSLKFYVDRGGAFHDITPLRMTTPAGAITFDATTGSSVITVTDPSHGAVTGDFVTFSGAASLGGNVTASSLNTEHQITVTDTNTYTITLSVTASSADSGNGGASVIGKYQINTGLEWFVSGGGFGAGGFGEGAFGGVGTITVSDQLRVWSQDNFGDDLIMNVRGGPIYYWDESAGLSSRAVALTALSGADSSTPQVALQVMVSDTDRHIIAFGCDPITDQGSLNPLHVRWSAKESPVIWAPSATNTAGGVDLVGGSQIIGALRTRQEILIWTDGALHSMRFVGGQFVFEFQVVSEGVGLIAPKAMINADSGVFFMGRGNFYVYNGAVQVLPCDVLDYVFSNLNKPQSAKVFGAHNPEFNEVTWFYPTGAGSSADISNYVTYNYLERVWTTGTLARGAWMPAISKRSPIAAGISGETDNYLYHHEVGHDADGEAMNAYIESGDLELADGEHFSFARRLLPDFEFSGATESANVTVSILGRRFPLSEPETLASVQVTQDTEQNHIRLRARQIRVRIESDNTGFGWRLGTLRLDLRTDGRR